LTSQLAGASGSV